MNLSTDVQIDKARTISSGIIVEFSDGYSFFYSRDLLLAMQQYAEELKNTDFGSNEQIDRPMLQANR